jgi:hypothetical protein
MRIAGHSAAAALLLSVAATGCGRSKTQAPPAPSAVIDTALVPTRIGANLRQAGGGHYHATLTYRVDVTGKPAPGDDGNPASPAALTSTTDLWMDRQGNYRLTESNDQDGGREIVRKGPEVAVALRYGKLVRRPAQDAESNRFLAEALGAPWAAWEIVRRQVEVQVGAAKELRFTLGRRRVGLPPGFPPAAGLRAWRDTVLTRSIEGHVTWASGGKLPASFTCKTAFEATRDGQPIAGTIEVEATLEQIGTVPDVVMPEADTLHPRQRTVLEERALLSGLGAGTQARAGKTTP